MTTLYDAARCPYCARVRIVLAEKGVPVDVDPIDLEHRPEWLYEKNPPAARVPVLEEGGWVLPESAVICEYLEERYPSPALLPADPAERAAARVVVLRFDDLGKPYSAVRRGEDGAIPRLGEALAWLERLLQERPWLTGRAFGLADVAYVPWLIRLRDLLDVDLSDLPAVSGWLDRAAERPSVAAEVEVVAGLRP